jgi:putative hydrolase of the HAD superfamily
MTSPKIIFFDAVGTLFGVRCTVGEIYAQFAQQLGIYVDAQQLNTAFIHSFKTAPRAAFTNVKPQYLPGLEYDWWRTLARRSFERSGVLAQIPDFDAFFRPLFTYFETADPWVVYPETLNALEVLKALGIELAIISNFDSRLHAVLKALTLEDWFQSVTISTQVGAAKPETEIFRMALAQHNYLPEQAWHVGDSWTEDYEGAITAGFQGIWLNRGESERYLTSPKLKDTPILEISNLMGLQQILQAQC